MGRGVGIWSWIQDLATQTMGAHCKIGILCKVPKKTQTWRLCINTALASEVPQPQDRVRWKGKDLNFQMASIWGGCDLRRPSY